MNIKLKGKYLYYLNYKIKCAIGKNGITKNKHEGDLKTPGGIFKLKKVFFRKDRIKFINTPLKKKKILKEIWAGVTIQFQNIIIEKLNFHLKVRQKNFGGKIIFMI